MLLLTSLLLAGHLQVVAVEVTLSTDSAVVEATFLLGDANPPSFVLIRQPGLSVQDLEVRGTEPVVREAPGLLRISSGGTPSDTLIRLRYTVRGRLDRIPLAVPDIPVPPEGPGVRIRIRGLPVDALFDRAFPRLVPVEEGTAVATLANVPSLVRLPPRRGSVPLSRVMEWLVVLLVVGSSVVWAMRARRHPRA